MVFVIITTTASITLLPSYLHLYIHTRSRSKRWNQSITPSIQIDRPFRVDSLFGRSNFPFARLLLPS